MKVQSGPLVQLVQSVRLVRWYTPKQQVQRNQMIRMLEQLLPKMLFVH
jgi:hypothetical protein